MFQRCEHGWVGPHEFWDHGAYKHCEGKVTDSEGIDLDKIKDEDWAYHEGYPRDMSELEQVHWLQRKAAEEEIKDIRSSSIHFGSGGNMRKTVFEGAPGMVVGDKVALRGQDGKVVKANLGQQYVGTCVAVDEASGLVTVLMG